MNYLTQQELDEMTESAPTLDPVRIYTTFVGMTIMYATTCTVITLKAIAAAT